MADSLHRIASVSPELAVLIRKVKAIYAVTSDSKPRRGKEKAANDFNTAKSNLLRRIDNVEALCVTRDSSGFDEDSRDLIRLKNQIRVELSDLQKDAVRLGEIHNKDMSKRKKPSGDELQDRAAFMRTLRDEMERIQSIATGHAPRATAADEVAVHISTEQLMSGGSIPGMNRRQEAMTDAQEAKMMQIHAETAVQDDLLDEMNVLLMGLNQKAKTMHDEVEIQNKIIDDVLDKADNTTDKLSVVNDRMKDTLKKVNSKSSLFCAYIVCLLIFLGLATVLYNMAFK